MFKDVTRSGLPVDDILSLAFPQLAYAFPRGTKAAGIVQAESAREATFNELQSISPGEERRRLLVEAGLLLTRMTPAETGLEWSKLFNRLLDDGAPSVRNAANKIAAVVSELGRKYVNEAVTVFGIFSANPGADPKVLLRECAVLWSHIRLSEECREAAITPIYEKMLREGPQGRFWEAFQGRLTKSNQLKFTEIANLLDILRDVALRSFEQQGPEGEMLDSIKRFLNGALGKKEGSLIAHLRMEQLLADLRDAPEKLDFEDVPEVFRLDDSSVCIEHNDGLKVSPAEASTKVAVHLSSINKIELITDNDAVMISEIYEDRLAAIRNLVNELKKLASEPLSSDQLMLPRADRLPDEVQSLNAASREFPIFMRRCYRALIEEQFSTPLSELGRQDQFYLIEFLKHLKVEHFESVRKFAQKFGVVGLRSYLSVDYGIECGREITGLGLRLKPEEGQALFAGFCAVVDASTKVGSMLRSAGGSTDQPARFLSDQLQEAFVRRSKDLLLASSAVLNSSQGFELRDIQLCLRAIKTFLELLADRHVQSRFAFEVLQEEEWLRKFHVVDRHENKEYVLKIFLRPERSDEGEARINCEMSFDTHRPDHELLAAFRQTTSRLNNPRSLPRTDSVLRVALDLDTFYEKIPRYGRSMASLDLGRNPFSGKTFVRSGDVLGKLLTLGRTGGNHNIDSFDPKLSEPENFAKLVRIFRSALF